MSGIAIQIQLFGELRKFGEKVNFTVPTGSTVVTIKASLQKKLQGERMILDSVIANNNKILRDVDIIEQDADLVVLPPVCGG